MYKWQKNTKHNNFACLTNRVYMYSIWLGILCEYCLYKGRHLYN